MQIDWFTFAAQIVNFLVLVWLLKRFLYRPVLVAIDGREQAIGDRLAVASERESAAEQSREAFEQQQAELSHLKESLLADAQRQADEWRSERLSEIRAEMDAARTSWQQSVQREQGQFLGELKQRAVTEVQELARHVLIELAGSRLEEQVIHTFLSRLDQDREGLQSLSSNGTPGTALVRTAFPLSPDDQAALSEDLGQTIGADDVRFEVDPDLICGIELVAGDHKLQWSVNGYLDALQHSVQSALRHEAAAPASESA